MKECSKCEQRLEDSDFHKDSRAKSGLSSSCKGCRLKDQQTENGKEKQKNASIRFRNTEKGREVYRTASKRFSKTEKGKINTRRSSILKRLRYPEKYWCRQELDKAIKRGDIKKRNTCEICHDSPTECHHDDYTKPFEFMELCKKHHHFLTNQYAKLALKNIGKAENERAIA
jgi:hypothetical protein